MGKIKLRKFLHDSLHEKYAMGYNVKKQFRDTKYIHSSRTYKTYTQQCNRFVVWCYDRNIKSPELAFENISNYILDMKINQNLPNTTIKTAVCAIAKAYNVKSDIFLKQSILMAKKQNIDIDFIRKRENITRSRKIAKRDKSFSIENNKSFIEFCKSTGLRRSEIQKLRADNIFFENGKYYIHIHNSKGGKSRNVEVIGDIQNVLNIFKNKHFDELVFDKIPSHCDIHFYRGEYAKNLYLSYARDINTIKKSEIYICRKDAYGKKFDKRAMFHVSKNLGHNRISVIASNYLY